MTRYSIGGKIVEVYDIPSSRECKRAARSFFDHYPEAEHYDAVCTRLQLPENAFVALTRFKRSTKEIAVRVDYGIEISETLEIAQRIRTT